MNPEEYLKKQGWKPGEGLRPGAIKKPLLVKHRKDNKGLGNNPNANDGWWERVFDGHLKSLDAFSDSNGVSFKTDQEKLRKTTSPLYGMFRSGGVLQGTIEIDTPGPEDAEEIAKEKKNKKEKSQDKKEKKEKKDKREKEKKEKDKKEKDKKEKDKKKEKKDKDKKAKDQKDKDSKDKETKKDKKRKRDESEKPSKKSKSSKSS